MWGALFITIMVTLVFGSAIGLALLCTEVSPWFCLAAPFLAFFIMWFGSGFCKWCVDQDYR